MGVWERAVGGQMKSRENKGNREIGRSQEGKEPTPPARWRGLLFLHATTCLSLLYEYITIKKDWGYF